MLTSHWPWSCWALAPTALHSSFCPSLCWKFLLCPLTTEMLSLARASLWPFPMASRVLRWPGRPVRDGPASQPHRGEPTAAPGAAEGPSLSLANIYSRSTMSFTDWKDKEREEPSPSCRAVSSSCSEALRVPWVRSAGRAHWALPGHAAPSNLRQPGDLLYTAALLLQPTCPQILLSSPPSRSQPPGTRLPGFESWVCCLG